MEDPAAGLPGVGTYHRPDLVEAPIAFHVENNVLTTTPNTIFADGGAFVIDRSAGVAGPSLAVLTAVNFAMVLLVWTSERRRRPTAG